MSWDCVCRSRSEKSSESCRRSMPDARSKSRMPIGFRTVPKVVEGEDAEQRGVKTAGTKIAEARKALYNIANIIERMYGRTSMIM